MVQPHLTLQCAVGGWMELVATLVKAGAQLPAGLVPRRIARLHTAVEEPADVLRLHAFAVNAIQHAHLSESAGGCAGDGRARC